MNWYKDARNRALWANLARRSLMRTQHLPSSKLPNCTFCGLEIRRGLQVRLNRNNYHPGCAVKVAHEKERDIADNRQVTEPLKR